MTDRTDCSVTKIDKRSVDRVQDLPSLCWFNEKNPFRLGFKTNGRLPDALADGLEVEF